MSVNEIQESGRCRELLDLALETRKYVGERRHPHREAARIALRKSQSSAEQRRETDFWMTLADAPLEPRGHPLVDLTNHGEDGERLPGTSPPLESGTDPAGLTVCLRLEHRTDGSGEHAAPAGTDHSSRFDIAVPGSALRQPDRHVDDNMAQPSICNQRVERIVHLCLAASVIILHDRYPAATETVHPSDQCKPPRSIRAGSNCKAAVACIVRHDKIK